MCARSPRGFILIQGQNERRILRQEPAAEGHFIQVGIGFARSLPRDARLFEILTENSWSRQNKRTRWLSGLSAGNSPPSRRGHVIVIDFASPRRAENLFNLLIVKLAFKMACWV